jgi:hypothetical protein
MIIGRTQPDPSRIQVQLVNSMFDQLHDYDD